MMTHLDEGTLLAHLDGEIQGAEAEGLREHLHGCGRCAARLEELEEDRKAAGAALAALDVRAPADAAREALRGRLARERPPGRPGRRTLARAAVLLLLAAGVAADRLPGSPLRGWIGVTLDEVRTALVGEREATESPAGAAGREAAESGVRVAAVGGRVRITLTEVGPGSRIDVRLVDGSEAGVRGTGGGSYRTAPGVVEAVGPGSLVQVEIPREVSSATVEVNGQLYLTKEGGRLEVAGPATDSTEAEIRFRTPPGDAPPGLD